MNEEISRVRLETQGRNVTVNGWQEGAENVPGFAIVADETTRTSFSVRPGGPLPDALDKAQARMAAGQIAKHESAGIRGESRTDNSAPTKGSGS